MSTAVEFLRFSRWAKARKFSIHPRFNRSVLAILHPVGQPGASVYAAASAACEAGATFQEHSQHHRSLNRMSHTSPIFLFADSSSFFWTWPHSPHAPPKLQDIEDFWIQLVFQFLCMLNRCAATSAAAVSGTRHTLRGGSRASG